jgi:hypothetical protein
MSEQATAYRGLVYIYIINVVLQGLTDIYRGDGRHGGGKMFNSTKHLIIYIY